LIAQIKDRTSEIGEITNLEPKGRRTRDKNQKNLPVGKHGGKEEEQRRIVPCPSFLYLIESKFRSNAKGVESEERRRDEEHDAVFLALPLPPLVAALPWWPPSLFLPLLACWFVSSVRPFPFYYSHPLSLLSRSPFPPPLANWTMLGNPPSPAILAIMTCVYFFNYYILKLHIPFVLK
jgi:hypothetical protein